MKKLLASLLVGALVSMGCSNSKTTSARSSTEVKKTTEASGAGTHTPASSVHTTEYKTPATETRTPGHRGTTEAKTSTKIDGKATSKTASTKR